jgi:Flp pilus assembly protein TadG
MIGNRGIFYDSRAKSQEPRAKSQERSVIARFKRTCLSFRKSVGGFGMIEAALLLPIFLGITFAVVDYGMMMSNRSSTVGNISSLSRTIQDNPNISAAELNALVVNAGGGTVNFTSEGNCFCAQSFTTQAAAQTFVNGSGCSGAACTSARNTGTGTPRFIGVRGQVTYNFITPVNTIFTGENKKVLKFGQVVPVGLNVCPAGEAFTSAGVCAASTVTCGAGQFLTASGTCSAAVPVCNGAGQILQFDGANFKCMKKSCRFVTNIGSAPNYISNARCDSDEIMESGGGFCETLGSGLCSGTTKGVMHFNAPDPGDPDGKSWSTDCFSFDFGGEACSQAYAYCCKLVPAP